MKQIEDIYIAVVSTEKVYIGNKYYLRNKILIT